MRLLPAGLLLASLALPATAQRIVDADPLTEVAFVPELGVRLPAEARFVDQGGHEVALGALMAERPAIVAFVYFDCPMLCNLLLEGLVKALGPVGLEVGSDFDVIAISIDPDEAPELARSKREPVLGAYAGDGRPEGWHFLTGSSEAIDAVTAAAGFRFAWISESGEFAHDSGLLMTSTDGVVTRAFFGVEFSPRDLRLGLVETSHGTVGTLGDRVVTLCYGYDPTTGTYGLLVMSLIRFFGGLLLVGIGVFVWRSVRRDRRARTRTGAIEARGATS